MKSEQETSQSDDLVNRTVHRLSAVVRLEPIKRRLYFIGWKPNGLPTITDDPSLLSTDARKSITEYRKARLPIRTVPSHRIEARGYVFIGRPVDYMDHEGIVAEDLLTYITVDEAGERRQETFGELSVLDAIVDAKAFWQDVARSSIEEIASSAQRIYTLILHPNNAANDTAYAVLFSPNLIAQSNEAEFKSFIRQTLGRLLIIDESQEPEHRKGYIDAAAHFSGFDKSKGIGILRFFYSFSDEDVDRLQRVRKSFFTGVLRIARALGLYEVSDEALESSEESLPYYDIDPLQIDDLFDLAAAMRDKAYQKIQGNDQ